MSCTDDSARDTGNGIGVSVTRGGPSQRLRPRQVCWTVRPVACCQVSCKQSECYRARRLPTFTDADAGIPETIWLDLQQLITGLRRSNKNVHNSIV